jgi:drug/metabolite transporter (DMT)-like permease
MGFIKFILAVLGLILGVYVFLWVLGIVTTLLWYGVILGLLAAVGYGGYKLFTKAEKKALGEGDLMGEIADRDYSMSWEEYDRKYLKK